MVHIFLIVFSLLNCIGQIYGSEQIQVIRVPLYSTNQSKDLIYAGQKYHNACKKFGMRSNPEDPFCSFVHKKNLSDKILKDVKVNDREKFKELYDNIDAVPFDCIVAQGEKCDFSFKENGSVQGYSVQGLKFKKKNEIISSSIVRINENAYAVVLIMPQVNPSCGITPEKLLGDFKREPSCFQGDEEELGKNGIIKKVNNKIFHGPNGYGTYYVRLFKRLSCALLFGAIIVYSFLLKY